MVGGNNVGVDSDVYSEVGIDDEEEFELEVTDEVGSGIGKNFR